MIQYIRTGDYWGIAVVCDHCRQPITDSGMAVAIPTKRLEENIDRIDVVHAHKSACHDALEAKYSAGSDYQVGWDELDYHLFHLLINSGYSPFDLTERLKQIQEAATKKNASPLES